MYLSPSVVLPNVQSLSVLHSLSRVCTVVPRLPADSPALFDSRAFHCPLLVPSPASNVLCRLALVLEINSLTGMILYTQRKETFVIGARGGHVAYATEMLDGATLSDLVEALKIRSKSTEGRQNVLRA